MLMIITNVGSLILYLIILIFLHNFLQLADVMDWEFIGKIMAIVCVSWLPLWLFKIIKKKVDPTDYEKIMLTVK